MGNSKAISCAQSASLKAEETRLTFVRWGSSKSEI